jgi:hypothetical protein
VSSFAAGLVVRSTELVPRGTCVVLLELQYGLWEVGPTAHHDQRASAMTSQPVDLVRELDHRRADGIDVRLLWPVRDGRVLVAVLDVKIGDAFTVEVADGDRAIDVFRHPFAYAAWRGVEMSGVDCEPAVAELRAA